MFQTAMVGAFYRPCTVSMSPAQVMVLRGSGKVAGAGGRLPVIVVGD